MRVTEAQRQMLHDLMLTDEPGGNYWAHFDPPFDPRTSAALVSRNLVEVKDGDQFRLTDVGRAFLSVGN